MSRATRPSWIAGVENAGVRLDKFLAAPDRLGSRSRVATALERGQVFLNGTEASPSHAAARLVATDAVAVWMDRPGSAGRSTRTVAVGDIRILYEDEDVIVVDKPPGLLTVPLGRRGDAPSVQEQLAHHLRSHRTRGPFVVHRIDLDTSGLVVFAKHPRAQALLKDQFRRREPERVYFAVVNGHPSPAEGTWRDWLRWDDAALVQTQMRANAPGAVEAICRYAVLETFAGAALLEVRLHTGKRNQIRIQASVHGHPLVGERQYIDRNDPRSLLPFDRQALHAHRLAFTHPSGNQPLQFESPLPADLRTLIRRLRAGSVAPDQYRSRPPRRR